MLLIDVETAAEHRDEAHRKLLEAMAKEGEVKVALLENDAVLNPPMQSTTEPIRPNPDDITYWRAKVERPILESIHHDTRRITAEMRKAFEQADNEYREMLQHARAPRRQELVRELFRRLEHAADATKALNDFDLESQRLGLRRPAAPWPELLEDQHGESALTDRKRIHEREGLI